ncbi:MAG: hypothetical protein VB063_05785 [Bacteroides graminisolvens]|nr:hypothetical protein [Bacteroides graminisolvens]
MSHPTDIWNKIVLCYPSCKELFLNSPVIKKITPSGLAVPAAITKIVIGQMLSRAAASTIFQRAANLADTLGTKPWLLSKQNLISCGISSRKAETIIFFGTQYEQNMYDFEMWPSLEYEHLEKIICSFPGLGEWSTAILCLFHFGHEDIFPSTDGTIKRALRAICDKYQFQLNPLLAKPYRSYLSLYLWQAIDLNLV